MDGIYALIDPSSAITALNMNDEFNLFGRKAYLIGHTFEAFPPIEDTPVQKAFAAAAPVVEEEGSLLDNFAVGVLATAALAGLAYVAFGAATVLTGGAALVLVGACLAGAAVATATVTVAATVQDVRSGHTRTAKEFAGQLGAAAVQGAVTGATLYGLQVAIPGASMLLGMDLAGAFGSSSITSVVHFSKVAAVAGYFLMAGQELRGASEIVRIGTGYNWVLENMFGGDAAAYDGTVAMMDALTAYTILVGWMNRPREERISREKFIEYATKELKEGAGKTYLPYTDEIPPTVQSRINLANGRTRFTPIRPKTGQPVSAGFNHVLDQHFNRPLANSRSIFSIQPDELKSILQSPNSVSSPVTAIPGGQYVRVIDTGQIVGNTALKFGGCETSWIQVFTDQSGNLITTYPIPAPH